MSTLHAVMSDSSDRLGSLNCSMPAAAVHCCVQVNVAIMLAPVAFLGHITSQPVEAMARMETDKVSSKNSLAQGLVLPYSSFAVFRSHSKQLLCYDAAIILTIIYRCSS